MSIEKLTEEIVVESDDDIHATDTLPMAAIREAMPSPKSPGSRRGSWSSGKSHRAPDPPSRPPSSMASSHPEPMTAKDKLRHIWNDKRERKQCLLWVGFAFALLFAFIIVFVIIGKFSAGFHGGGTNGSSDLELYDTEDPEPGNGAGSSIGAASDVIMLIGGDGGASRSVEIITAGGKCSVGDSLPDNMVGHTVAVVKGPYAAAGVIVCGGTVDGRQSSETCWRFITVDGKWIRINPIIRPVTYAAAIFRGREMFVFGGNDNGHKLSYVQVLDVTSNHWRFSGDMPAPAWGHCAAKSGDTVVLSGGWGASTSEKEMRSARMFDFSTRAWTRLPDMKEGRATHGCLATKYKHLPAYIVVGGQRYDNTATDSVEMLVGLNGGLIRWKSLARLDRPRSWYPAVGVIGNRLLVASGKNRFGSGEDSVEAFNPSRKRWVIQPTILKWKRHDGRGVVVPVSWFPQCIK